MEIIEAFGCSHCGMASRYKKSVMRHERDYCKSNPNRQTCANCEHWIDEGDDSDGSGFTWRDCGCSKEVELDGASYNENNICIEFKKVE